MDHSELIGNSVSYDPDMGYFLYIFDHRPETILFMENNHLQGGGPTWAALIQAALELESPDTFNAIDCDDESDCVIIRSPSKPCLEVVQTLVSILMCDSDYMMRCIEHATRGGYIE